MKLPRRQFLKLAAVAIGFPAVSHVASAQAYPAQPVRIIVGFAAGGAPDIAARLLAQWLSERLGQQFVVENRPGAGGNIATEAVVDAPADGYALLLVSLANAVNATLYEKLNYNFIRDIAPVASISHETYCMEVHPSFPAKTVAEFIAYAKANPGKLNMASAGIGTGPHMAGELFKMMAGVDMVHVPYRGSPPALTDLLAGQVQVMFSPLSSSIGYVRGGKLVALAVTTTTRSLALPDLPTVGEFVPGYEASQGNARRDRRQAQQGDQCGPRRFEAEGAPCRPRLRRICRFAVRLRKAYRRGNREVVQGDPGGPHQSGVTAGRQPQ